MKTPIIDANDGVSWERGVTVGRKRFPSGGQDAGEGWEDAAQPAVLAAATELDGDEPRLSLMNAAARLLAQGLGKAEAAAILGVSYSTFYRATSDPRFAVVQRRLLVDSLGLEAAQVARASYRTEKAYEVLERELDSKNEWLAHGAAVALIAASKADESKGRRRIEVIMSPSMAYDDQEPDGADAEDMQEDCEDDAETLDSGINHAFIPHS